jgi:hypothetical protein
MSSTRDRTLSRMKYLGALTASIASAGCGKDTKANDVDASAGTSSIASADASADADAGANADASADADASANAGAKPSASATSTAYVVHPVATGYAVVDPIPPPIMRDGGRTGTPAASCDPPYYYDANGHKVYKRSCL